MTICTDSRLSTALDEERTARLALEARIAALEATHGRTP